MAIQYSFSGSAESCAVARFGPVSSLRPEANRSLSKLGAKSMKTNEKAPIPVTAGSQTASPFPGLGGRKLLKQQCVTRQGNGRVNPRFSPALTPGKSAEMPIDPSLANTLRFAHFFALTCMTLFFRNAFIRQEQSVGHPLAYLSWSRTSS